MSNEGDREICKAEMVIRGSSHYRNSITGRFLSRKSSSHFAITFQIFCIFAFSIFVFLVYTRNSLEDEHTQPFLSKQSQYYQVFFFLGGIMELGFAFGGLTSDGLLWLGRNYDFVL